MAATENEKIFIGPDEGAHLPILGITHKVTAEHFGGAFTSIEGRIPPGDMIPPHTHTREDECAFVLEGELTFDVGGRIVAAPAGSFVLKPRGVYHAFCNTGTEVARVLEFHAPGAFEDYYDEYEEIVEGDMGEDERRRARIELGERYGVVWHDELVLEAMARFGIGPSERNRAATLLSPSVPIHPSTWTPNSRTCGKRVRFVRTRNDPCSAWEAVLLLGKQLSL